MAKSVIFKAVNNRIQFKCSECKAKRNMSVPPDVRVKSIRCHKCGELTRAIFNRRLHQRESQMGMVQLKTAAGREVEVMLQDRSYDGLGFNIPVGTAKSYRINVGQQIQLFCSWNPRLLPRSTFIVQNVSGQRVGVQVK